MKPKISVIICCYNVENYIRKCLDSVISQTIGLENMEIILINDASTDHTRDILMEYKENYKDNMVFIDLETNQKLGTGRNIGIKCAKADYIGFVDADDWIDEEMYQDLYEKINTYKCDIASCTLYREFVDRPVILDYGEERLLKRGIDFLEEGGENKKQITPSIGSWVVTKLYRKERIVENNIWFPEQLLFEDNYWMPVILLQAESIYYINKAYYHYRYNATSITAKKNDNRIFDRLIIEKMKLQKYHELGIDKKYPELVEMEFLQGYFKSTFLSIVMQFDIPPYNRYVEICQGVKKEFPDYKKNPLLNEPEYIEDKNLLQVIEMELTEEELQSIADDYKALF